MQFLTILATLIGTSAACKCFNGSDQDDTRTDTCCGQLGGVFNTDDCRANSISEHLSDFRKCCGGASDCDYPGGIFAETEQEGVKTILMV